MGCFNIRTDKSVEKEADRSAREYFDGAIAVCDDCGVVIIPRQMHTEGFMDKLRAIEEQEDIWFDRLDRRHENTFDIVCEKKYLKENR